MAALLLAALLAQVKPPPLPKDDSTLVKVADQAKLPSLALDADGNAYVAFVRNGNIELAISSDGGKTFSAPVIALNSGGKDAGIPNRSPRVCVDKQKRIWVSGPLCLAPPNAPLVNDLYFCVSLDRGKTFSKPFMINDAPGCASESVHAAAAGATDLHVAWVDTKKGHALLYCKFDTQGKRVGKIVPLTGFCCENCPPGLAVDPAGNPSIAWREGPRELAARIHRQIFLSRSTDGGKSFASTNQLNSLDSGLEECPQDPPAAAFSADGKLLAAAWMERRDVERDADIFWAFGPPGKFGPDTCCQDDRRFQQRRPTLAVDVDGCVWCAWEDSRLSTLRVFYTHSKTDVNIPIGDAKEGGGSSPSLASGGGKVAIAYQMGGGVGFRVLATK
jgi:hypothetical protein